MEIGFLTDIGLKREINEDTILVDADKKIIILADGMGGHLAGEVASRLAVDVAYRVTCEGLTCLCSQDDDGSFKELLKSAFVEANSQVFKSSSMDNLKGMGTTLLEVIICADRAFVCSIGDSRAYLYRQERLQQITTDHTVADYYLKRGEDINFMPKAYFSMLTKAIGTQPEVEPDLYAFDLSQGDIMLMATDGLFNMLDKIEMQSLLASRSKLDSLAGEFVQRANVKGGKDNITVALYRH